MFLIVIPLLLFSAKIEKEIAFSIRDLEFSEFEGYDVVRLRYCTPTAKISEPELTTKPLLVLIPPSATVRDIEIVSAKKIMVDGTFNILPTQYPEPFSLHEPLPFVEPNEQVYSQTTEYPGMPVEITHFGTKGGYQIVTVTLYPLQYVPAQGKLFLYTHIKFRINYDEGQVTPEVIWKENYQYQMESVKRLVINPEDVEKWSPQIKECDRSMNSNRTFDNPEYAIMVANGFESYFDPLRDWKVKKGVTAEIFLRDWILANYSGATDEDKVRNFVIDYHQNHGTLYFLCVGDWGDFPMKAITTVDDPTTPSDFFYADYDEDLYTEAYVGRASISNATEAQTFVNKVLKYEQETPATGFHEKIFLPGFLLWSGYGIPVNDTIAVYDPPSWLDAKRYDEIQPLPTQEISDSFNVGFGYTDIAAHGAWNQWGGTSYHTNSDADGLTNAPPLTGVITAICCNIGQLDYSGGDCYVEHMMNNPHGGSAAFWGNSRHGYGRIENTGRSESQCIWFYDELTNHGVYNIGRTIAGSNDRAAPYVAGDEYVFHCMHTCVLYGDPEMAQWTFFPEPLMAVHNNTVPTGNSVFDVTVTDNRAPVANARVCLMCQTDTFYAVDYTNASGVASFAIYPSIEGDTMWVTVTCQDYNQYEGHAIVTDFGVSEWNNSPYIFGLAQPYPNPSTNPVGISYSVAKPEKITLKVYDAIGQLVTTLVNEHKNPGEYRITWNGKYENKILASGIYFLRLSSDEKVIQRKIIFIRD